MYRNLDQCAEVLRSEMIKHAIIKLDKPTIKLSSGEMSDFYADCRKVTLSAIGQYCIGQLMYEVMRHTGAKYVGGLTLGADPIVSAISYTSMLHKNPIDGFLVRKKTKDHGMGNVIEGRFKGDVVIVDDVLTSGGSIIQAIEQAKIHGLNVVMAMVILDREEMNGRENVEKHVKPLISLFRKSSFI